ncbi:hypothetical protein WA026_004801 [Henosepilachna vigintioctopunctata]|uniref:Uncharacterized protein n=1 Tax=Henosepilachna vigintioctopunctata TaxID=420089 RepID=A0AAW1UVJ2_9CUCU
MHGTCREQNVISGGCLNAWRKPLGDNYKRTFQEVTLIVPLIERLPGHAGDVSARLTGCRAAAQKIDWALFLKTIIIRNA